MSFGKPEYHKLVTHFQPTYFTPVLGVQTPERSRSRVRRSATQQVLKKSQKQEKPDKQAKSKTRISTGRVRQQEAAPEQPQLIVNISKPESPPTILKPKQEMINRNSAKNTHNNSPAKKESTLDIHTVMDGAVGPRIRQLVGALNQLLSQGDELAK